MDSLSWAILVSSVLSLMGSATVIGFHMAIPANQRTHIFRLVLWLMVAEFFKALTSFISVWINTEASFICLIIAYACFFSYSFLKIDIMKSHLFILIYYIFHLVLFLSGLPPPLNAVYVLFILII